MRISIIGTGITKFGELWGTSPRALAREAVTEALIDAKREIKDIDAIFVGNMLSGMLGGQEHLGALFADEFGITGGGVKVEGACASGGLAMHLATQSVASGQYETVIVLGVEKMTDHKPEQVAGALVGAGSAEERVAGATFPSLYALLARAHMQTYGTTESEMASVAVKNHYHASLNPKAQFHTCITVDQVMCSGKIADPLKLLDCSPISDGAAAVIITSKKEPGIEVAASVMAMDSLGLSGRSSLTELKASRIAAQKAYAKAGVTQKDIQLLEVHDCFTIAEILALEDMGFAEKGTAGKSIERGDMTLGTQKQWVVNSSGGLKGCGHPVGATGVKQIVEIADQLRGRCRGRQVDGANVGLTHNVGGSGATAVIHILKNNI